MKNILKISLCLLGASMFLAACDEAETWTPGPEDNEIGVQAYFPEQSTSVILSPLDPLQIVTTVNRHDTEGTASIPMTVTCTADGLAYPQTVEFEAGQSEANFVIDCSGLPVGQFQTITVALPDNQTDVYGDGMTSLSMSVIVAEWKLIADDLTYYYTDDTGEKVFPNTQGTMYHLDNTNYFRMTDFFGSGLDVMFQINNPKGENFTPLTNAYWDTDYYDYNIWYLYDEANGAWISWYPDANSDLGITYIDAYGDGYSKIYMLYDEESLYGYATIKGYLMYTDNSWSNWMAMQIDFTLKYNPFK